jgi:CheY-like chemotaxis protein
MTTVQKHILLAEDNPVLSRIIEFNLKKGGYSVTTVANGGDAMALLLGESFDLLITDYQMPGHDGAALCDFVRGNATLAQLPIILCTAKGLELNASELAARWQLVQVFFKPFSMSEIVTCIQRYFANAEVPHESLASPACSP